MNQSTGWIWVASLVLTGGLAAQTLGNQTLSGKYYFRHVSLGTDGTSPSNMPDPRSLIGTIAFDGSGKYTFTGQQVTGNAAAAAASGSGSYTVDPGGFVSLDSPLRTGAKVNARYGAEALLGSSTEASDSTFDLFIAIPAPTAGAVLGGPYTTVSLELSGGSVANLRTSQFSINASGPGSLQNLTVNGHAVNLGGRVQTQ